MEQMRSRRPSPIVSVLAVLALAATAMLGAACGESSSAGGRTPTDPQQAAPIAPASSVPAPIVASSIDPIGVGVTHMKLSDPSRRTGARGGRVASDSRELPLTIWYPSTGEPGDAEYVDAAPVGQWPLIVFAHGFEASAATYAPLLRAVAAAGFVVVVPEFPLSSSTVDAAAVEGDEPEQANDIGFIIDTLTAGDPLVPLSNAIEPGPVGVMGHSDGAQTALLSGFAPRYRNERIGAVVAVSGRYSTFGGQWFDTGRPALLVVQAADDELNPFRYGEELVRLNSGPASLVAVDGVTHLGAVTDPRAIGPVAALVADTFAWRLRGSTTADDRLASDVLTAPLRLVASHG